MKKSLILVIAALLSTLALTGCFESSDLIGKWQSEKVMGIQSSVEFKSGSIVSSSIAGDTETKIDGYVSEKNRLGVVIKQGDQKATVWYDVKDHDTISQNVGGMIEVVFHRVK